VTAPLWLACPESALPPGTAWLTAAEAAYAERQRYTKRRVEFLLARFTAKTAVAAALGLSPAAASSRVEIRHEPSGAPFACVDGSLAPVQVSSTDRAGWATCLVSAAPVRVGCDLELVEPRSAAFVADWFTAAERRYVESRDGDDARNLAANLVWSAKESALKVLTTGLRRDTRTVEVSVGAVAGSWQPLTVTVDTGAQFPGWWRRLGRFVLTVAAAAPLSAPAVLPSPWDIAAAEPTHSWLVRPTVSPQSAAAAMPRSSASIT